MPETQNYRNHTRWYPLVHFIISPLLVVLIIWALVCVIMEFEWFRVQILLLAIVGLLLSFAARLQALAVQNRVIRLEERLRYESVLSPDLAAKAKSLSVGQIIALRFATDEELPNLIERTLAGEFAEPKNIKMEIKEWRGDYLRA